MIAVIHRGQKFKETMEAFQQNEWNLSHRKSEISMQKPCMCFWNGFVATATNLIE